MGNADATALLQRTYRREGHWVIPRMSNESGRVDMRRHFWRYVILLLTALLLPVQPFSGGEPWQSVPPNREGEAAEQEVRRDSVAKDQGVDKNRFVVMTFNTGTTLGLRHDQGTADGYSTAEAKISDRWYGNGLSWRAAVTAVRKMIAEVGPDIVAFQEIFDCLECKNIPVEEHQGFVCEGLSPGDANVAQLVLGQEYQIAYHPGKRSKCLAVHRRFGTFRGYQSRDCGDVLEGAEVKGCGSGARIARAVVERRTGQTLTVISVHGTSGLLPKDQQCRVRQVERIFLDFGDGQPGVNGRQHVILGDFNTDPGRAAAIDASAARWNDFVGQGKAFHFVSKIGADAPRSYRRWADIDHVVSDGFQGSCRYLGLDETSPPVWHGVYFDHVPVICTLWDDRDTDSKDR